MSPAQRAMFPLILIFGSKLRRFLLFLLACLALTLVLTACGPKSATPPPRLGNGSLRWRSFPVAIQADASLFDHGEAENDLHAALAFWESRAGKQLFTLTSWPSGQAPSSGGLDHLNSSAGNVLFFQNPWPDSGEWGQQVAGKTIMTSTDDEIDQAVIFLNAEIHLCPGLCQAGEDLGKTSRRRLIAHEMGHFLGLLHVADPANIMYPSIQPGGDLERVQVDLPLLQKLTR